MVPPAASMALDRGRREAVRANRERLGRARPARAPSPGPAWRPGRWPAACRACTSAPASKPSSGRRFTTWYSTRNGLLKPFAFGVRRCSGVWPPSNRAGTVPRAPWPLLPRPAVLPPLPPMPRPTRRLALREPGSGFQIVDLHWSLLDRDEVRHPRDHAADLGPVGQRVGAADPAEPERAERAALLGLDADLRAHERDLDAGSSIRHSTSAPRACRAALAVGVEHPLGRAPLRPTCRAGCATSSGRRSARRPCIVARATLIAFDEPSDLASTSWMPAASRMARAAPPAITPVPGAAGFISTRAASCSPSDHGG